MTTNEKQLYDVFEHYNLDIKCLKRFIKIKKQYKADSSTVNRIAFKMAYTEPYEEIKVLCYSSHKISENEFNRLKGLLQDFEE